MLTTSTFAGSSAFFCREHREQLERCAARGRAQLLAGDVGNGLDRRLRLHQQREGRLRIDHVDHHGRLGARRGVLDDGVHVAEACVIGARHDARHGRGRAFALVDGDVEPFGLEVPFVGRPVVPGVDALELPVERELDLLLRGRGRERQHQACGERRETGEHGSFSCCGRLSPWRIRSCDAPTR